MGLFKRVFGGGNAPGATTNGTVKCPKCGHTFGTREELRGRLVSRMGGGAFGQAMFGNPNSTNMLNVRCPGCSAEITLIV